MKKIFSGAAVQPKNKKSKKREPFKRHQGRSDDPKVSGGSLLFGCHQIVLHSKKAYDNEREALTAIATKLKYEQRQKKVETAEDWISFTLYECPYCHKIHLTKVRNDRER